MDLKTNNNNDMNNNKFITDSCLSWEANDMRNVIESYNDAQSSLSDDQCNEMLGKFFAEYREAITNEIFELMLIWIKEHKILQFNDK
jgi:hypothetical protein